MGASASGVRAGSAYVELFATDNKLSQTLNRAASKVKKFGGIVRNIGIGLSAAAAAVTVPLTAIVYKMAESGAAMYQASQRTGVAVEELSALKYAATQTGTDIEGLEMGFRKMGKAIVEAADGNKEAQQTFSRLGLSVSEFTKMTPEQRFAAVADAIAKIHDPSERAALAMKMFGKTGTSLLPMMEDGAAGIEKWKNRAKELGLVSSTDGVKGAAQFQLALNDLELTTKKLWSTVAGSIIPILRQKAEVMTGITVKAIAWAKQNKALFATIFKVAAIVGVVGAAIVVFGTIISSVGSAMIGLSAIVGTLVTIFAAVVSPIGLIVAGLFGGAAALLYFTDVGKIAGNFLMGVFRKIYDAIKFVFDNTSTAAGAWSAILSEAGYIVRDVWLAAKGALVDAWYGFATFMQTNFSGITQFILEATNVATTGFLQAWTVAMKTYRSLVNTTSKFIFDTFYDNTKQLDAEMDAYIDKAVKAGKLTAAQGEEAKNKEIGASGYNNKAWADRQAQTAQLDAESDAKMAGIRKDYEDRKAELEARSNKTNPKLLRDIAKAKADADAAIANERSSNAAAKAKMEADLKAAHAAGGDKSLADKFKDILKGVDTPELTRTPPGLGGDGMDGILKKMGTSGTFNARVAPLLAGGSPIERIMKATERTAKATEALALTTRTFQGGETFVV